MLLKKAIDVGFNLKLSPNAMNLAKLFEAYNVPSANQVMVKIDGVPVKYRDNFIAYKSEISKVILGKDEKSSFVNIISKAKK